MLPEQAAAISLWCFVAALALPRPGINKYTWYSCQKSLVSILFNTDMYIYPIVVIVHTFYLHIESYLRINYWQYCCCKSSFRECLGGSSHLRNLAASHSFRDFRHHQDGDRSFSGRDWHFWWSVEVWPVFRGHIPAGVHWGCYVCPQQRWPQGESAEKRCTE